MHLLTAVFVRLTDHMARRLRLFSPVRVISSSFSNQLNATVCQVSLNEIITERSSHEGVISALNVLKRRCGSYLHLLLPYYSWLLYI